MMIMTENICANITIPIRLPKLAIVAVLAVVAHVPTVTDKYSVNYGFKMDMTT